MFSYDKILVAVDLGEYTGDLIDRALAIADDPSAVHVVYVQQRMSAMYRGVGPIGSALQDVDTAEDDLGRELKARLRDWTDSKGIPSDNVHYLNGKPAELIENFARDNDVQLVVMATHERKGLQRLLGSTANAVVHSAPCDVLTVHAD